MVNSNQTKQQGTGFNNLKIINSLQSNGTIQELLRDLKNYKSELEEYQNKVVQRHHYFEQQKTVSTPVQTETIEKTIINEVVEKQPEDVKEKQNNVPERKPDNNSQTFNKKPYSQTNNQYNHNREQRDNRPPFQNRNNFQDNRNGNFQQNNFQQNNFQQNNFQKRNFQQGYQTNGQNRPNYYQQNNQSNNNSRPNFQGRPQFNNNRPFAPKTPSNGFVSSKANNFKTFETPSTELLSPTITRTFGNKNKAKQQIDEKKSLNKKSLLRKNIIVGQSADFDDERMGSRKVFKSKKKEVEVFIAPEITNAVITTENITVKSLSEKIGKPVAEIIKKLMILGVMATINSSIDFTTAELICGELGIKLEQKLDKTFEEQLKDIVKTDDDSGLIKRPPVVTVMGHVDHGKTSLLDYIRNSNVVGKEAGGITQRIGAYQIISNNEKITFIDTPGHAAFTAMRARGAKATDIAVLVVAADDGIMPQTIEAINHIKAANVPMIVAINKMDKPEAKIERVKEQLAENGVLPEEWGGDAILVPVSAKTGVGVDKLISMILLVAEMQNLKADPTTTGVGVVIEAELDKNRGPVASVLVQNGTIKIGDNVMAGITFGKIKAMFDENGKSVTSAGPATPVAILGFNDVPTAGDQIFSIGEKLSKQVIDERIDKLKVARSNTTSGVSLDDFMDRVNEGKLKNLNVIIKADVQGSVEALKQTLTAIRNDEVKVVCIHSGAGPVTESDLILAQASNAIVVNFNLKIGSKIQSLADNLKVQIKDCKVIYEIVDDVTNAINGMMTVKYEKVIIGHAEVRLVFKLSSSGVVAGSYIKDGKAARNAGVTIMRNEEVVCETAIESLKIQKDDKAEVNYGYECGIKLKDSSNVKEGDILEIYQNVPIKK